MVHPLLISLTKSLRALLIAQTPLPVRAVAVLRILPHRAAWLALLIYIAAGIGVASRASGQGISREYKLKAVYLYKFATYVKWPKPHASTSPFVIGILGPDPVGADLRKIAQVKKIDGRPIEVRNYQKIEEINNCQILFMSRAVTSETQKAAIKLLLKKNVLLVGETKEFLNLGGVINFVILENRVQIHISESAYKKENLEVSAQLLRIATVVK